MKAQVDKAVLKEYRAVLKRKLLLEAKEQELRKEREKFLTTLKTLNLLHQTTFFC